MLHARLRRRRLTVLSGALALATALLVGQAGAAQPAHADYGVMIQPITGSVSTVLDCNHAPGHHGVDILAPAHTPIIAAYDGHVIERQVSYASSGYGNMLMLEHAGGYKTRYAHMVSAPLPSSGADVQQGDVIGYVGTTGLSTANHLHFEILRNDDFHFVAGGYSCQTPRQQVTQGNAIPMEFPGLGPDVPPAPVYDDFGIYRNVDGVGGWHAKAGPSGSSYLFSGIVHGGWGQDRPLVGDFNGDGIDDLVIYRNDGGSGKWYVKKLDGTFLVNGVVHGGWSQDIPVVGDFDGGGADLGIYRNIDGVGHWYVKNTGLGWVLDVVHGGWPQDVPLAGDFDADGRDDLVIYRAYDGTGHWYVKRNDGSWVVDDFLHGGWPQDVPVVGDFDGDGRDDFGIYRPIGGTGYWYVKSLDGTMLVDGVAHGGWAQDIPVVGNFG
jgi:hypothetical protein